MMRKGIVLAVLAGLLLGESLYFYRQCLAGFERLLGERAFYRNDLAGAWARYHRGVDLGGPEGLLERDQIEVLLFALDTREVGGKGNVPLDDAAALAEIRRLNARAIRRAPYRALHWSVASDIFFREGRLARRSVPLDIGAVSEEPLQNLTPEDWWGIAALEKASALEPNNYLFDDLITEQLLAYGAVDEAARASRRAVEAYPRLAGHAHLSRTDLPQVVLDATVEGFEAVLNKVTLIAAASIEIDTGRLLVLHGEEKRAIPFLERAVAGAPDSYDAQVELALALLRDNRAREAVPHFEKASLRLPEEPSTYYFLGEAQIQIGERAAAIKSLQKARILGRGAVKYFQALGNALESEGRTVEAERQFTAAAYQNPTDGFAWSELAAFHLRQGNREAAARDCEKLLPLVSTDDRAREQCAAIGAGGA